MEILVLDTRPQSRAAELARLAIAPAIGVEVTGAADLAAACAFNLDGQHHPGADGTPAVEMALGMAADPYGYWAGENAAAIAAWKAGRYATVRPDRDAFAAIALLAWGRQQIQEGPLGREFGPPAALDHIRRIADADRSAPRTPGPVDPGTGEPDAFDALGAAVADHKLSPELRAELVWEWITTGAFAGQGAYVEQVAKLRTDVDRLEGKVELVLDGRVATITTPSPMGVVAAYRRASVVVALNPAHRWPQGHTTAKITVCQQPGSGLDLTGLAVALNARLPEGARNTWGGVAGATLGSPQGEDPGIGFDELTRLVGRYLA